MRINTKCRCIFVDSQVVRTLEAVGRDLPNSKLASSYDTYINSYNEMVTALKEQLDETGEKKVRMGSDTAILRHERRRDDV